MVDIIVIIVVAVIILFAALYIYKSKKSGKKCIGCPYSDSCSKCSNCCDTSLSDSDK